MTIAIPRGFRFAGVHCGVKRNPNKEDLTLVVSDLPAVAAGVYTRNLVFAAPVALDRSRTPADKIHAVVVNSGNANACTGDRGMADAREMARLAALACGAAEGEALVMSTGVIGQFLPMDKIAAGIQAASASLAADEAALKAAARGILTTDGVTKVAGRSLAIKGAEAHIVGIAKGAAMIGPNMATMLSLIVTDLAMPKEIAQSTLIAVVDATFNCISVEGHMSTNDTVLLLANGASEARLEEIDSVITFMSQLGAVCDDLATAIVADGEGATHLVRVRIEACRSRDDGRRVAKTIAESALVKTAIAGGDPNWGRIVSAAGYAGVAFDPAKLSLKLNGHLLYQNGAPVAFDAAVVSASIKQNAETLIELFLGTGEERLEFKTTDLTAEYVRLNADYTT
ncbi:MAG: bifunctional glutamate N-acetyltransferase/amino-acid acetyltransferase ArgJ [Pirellulales bacterium]